MPCITSSRWLGWLAVATLSFTMGCSSLLYYPTSARYYDPAQLHLQPEEVNIKSANGNNINGWYIPNTLGKKPKAILIFFHGNGENMTSHYVSLSWLPPKGYDYFIFDYQGYGMSEGNPSPERTVEDGIAAIKYVHERSKGRPLVVFAQSLGGAVAMKALIELKHSVPIKYVVIDSSFLSYKKVARSILRKHWFTWIAQPFTYILLSDKWAPDDDVSQIAPTPMLVMHGTQDQVINYEFGEDVYAKAGEPKEFWKVEGGRHTDAFWRHGDVYREKFLKVLEKVAGEK